MSHFTFCRSKTSSCSFLISSVASDLWSFSTGAVKHLSSTFRGMLIQRLRWVRHPPIASSVLMLLLSLFWVTGVGETFVLSPSLLTSPSQAFRLVTYCLCHANASLLVASLLFFPLLGWRVELQQGTLCYLQATGLSAAVSALLYILLAGLWGAKPHATISGHIPVHLALLACHGRHSGWLSMALLAGLLFGLGEILSPHSPFLLHLSGLLTGLAYCAGTSSSLGLSKRHLERLRDGTLCWSHIGGSFLRFIRPVASGTLPATARKERIPAQEMFPSNLAGTVAIQVLPPSPSWSDESAAQESQLLFPSTSLHPFSAFHGASDTPFFALPDSLIEEELIQAGIQASLQDIDEEEVKLPKSSVSSLRLQQLQKMGFPTEEAVIALAATGHVEGAVSLLIGGHVGDRAVVTAENHSAPHTWPQTSPSQ